VCFNLCLLFSPSFFLVSVGYLNSGLILSSHPSLNTFIYKLKPPKINFPNYGSLPFSSIPFFAFFYFHYLLHWTGYWILLYPYLVVIWITAAEYLQYILLGDKNETFVIKLSKNPSDFFLFPIVTSSHLCVAIFNPYTSEIFTPVCIFYWVLLMLASDLSFGFLHILCHTHPYLRKLHMVHHEYRREDLNSFATFYSDFTDALFMNVPGMVSAILTIMFSVGTLPFKELGLSMGYLHHKYPTYQLTVGYFFEFELIDMIMNRVRLSNFHNLHHNLLDQNFSIFGFLSDEAIFKVNQFVKNGYLSVGRTFKLYNSFKEGLSN